MKKTYKPIETRHRVSSLFLVFTILLIIVIAIADGASHKAPTKEEPAAPPEPQKEEQLAIIEETKEESEPEPIYIEATVTYIEPEPIVIELTRPEPELISIGECKITHYCCELYEHICGYGLGITATGAIAEPGVVAVDPNVIPLGSKVLINGNWYRAEDTGGAIKGNAIDICVETHEKALSLGMYYAEVFVEAE